MVVSVITVRTSHIISLRWRHNGRDSVSNHQPHDCLLNRLFGRRSKKTWKLRVTGLCAGNSPGTGEFTAQMASDAENVSIWWRHHVSINSRDKQRLPLYMDVLSAIEPRVYRFIASDTICMLRNITLVITLKTGQNARHFPDDIFKCIFMNDNIWISNAIWLMFAAKCPIDNIQYWFR